jgi:hypothetical protein
MVHQNGAGNSAVSFTSASFLLRANRTRDGPNMKRHCTSAFCMLGHAGRTGASQKGIAFPQYPSNARPTQPIAKIEQASTVTEARVATALIENSIELISLEQRQTLGGKMSAIMAEELPHRKIVPLSQNWHSVSEQ